MGKRKVLNDVFPLFLLIVLALLLSPIIKTNHRTDIVMVETSYSFPANTLVTTPEGTKPIGDIFPGEIVMAYNLEKREWQEASVRSNVEKSFSGQMVELTTSNGSFSASSTHLFLVLDGEDIANRAVAKENVPEDLNLSGPGHWLTAENLMAGDTIPGAHGPVELTEVSIQEAGYHIVFSLVLEGQNLYGVGPQGLTVADRSLIIHYDYEDDYSGGSSGGCFPAGTQVLGPEGIRYIEEIQPGEMVFSLSDQGEWQEKEVLQVFEKPYEGTMLRLQVGGLVLHVTENHPILVLEGDDLYSRPVPRDLPDEPLEWFEGRWVEARDLKARDVIMTHRGPRSLLSAMAYGWEGPVYNIEVEDNHNYTVSLAFVLVHNKGSADRSSMEMSDELYDMKSEEEVWGMEEPSPSPDGDAAVRREREEGSPPQESGLRAGYADDNRQFNYFLNFLQEYSHLEHFELDVTERIILHVEDEEGRSIPNALVRISRGDEVLCQGLSHADGKFYFFPSQYEFRDRSLRPFLVSVESPFGNVEAEFFRNQERELTLQVPNQRPEVLDTPLDILFVLDTTGSMGSEIQRLKDTIELIKLNLSSINGLDNLRFGLVLYKDRGDTYVTQTTALTQDLQHFQADLDQVYADGGGDGPEDLQAALASSIRRMNWNPEAVKLAFVITDAPPHLDYANVQTYTESAIMARERGIKFYTVGTGGLNTQGEYVLRQISQFTGARYIFLTYGETGESHGGAEGSVSHHTGDNFQTDKLESIIIQFAREEMSHLLPISMNQGEDFYSVQSVGSETTEETLQKLFTQACGQLLDYSSISIPLNSPTALVPFSVHSGVDPSRAELLQAQLLFSLTRQENLREHFSLVDRSNLQQIMEELRLQLSGVISQESSVEIGELLGAQLILTAEVHSVDEEYQVFLKLLRVETGEILSITKAVIPQDLF